MQSTQNNENLKPLPVGESDLASILKGNCIYIDKTKDVYNLVTHRGKYFLSRPRRFGKSTLISTFYEIFRGNRELFKDQWIYNSDYSWDEYPIIRISFTGAEDKELTSYIKHKLHKIAIHYQVSEQLNIDELDYNEYFGDLLESLYQKYQRQVVVLIDEYDKPILDVIEDVALAEKKRDILKGFYGVMKGADEHLRFVFLTGVTRFAKVGIFSGLNNLDDISMDEKYATICGITQAELETNFSDYIDQLAHKQDLTHDECISEIKRWYNGFYFSENLSEALSVYNPFSTLLLFEKNKFTNYWFASSSSAFLIKLIKKNPNFNLQSLDKVEMSIEDFDSFEIDNLNLNAIMYQAGYLTIKGYDKENMIYSLGYTNYEIDKTFKSNLLSSYLVSGIPSSGLIFELYKAFINQQLELMIEKFKEIFFNIDYSVKIDEEKTFQNIIYLIFILLGFRIDKEHKTNIGRIDAIVFHNDNVYIFEFKKNKTAKDAISQIHDKGYYKQYQNTGKNIYLIGMNYNTVRREIDDYLIEQI
jgi:hypothetical protein